MIAQIRQEIIEAVSRQLGVRDLACSLCGSVVWMPPTIVTLPEVVFEEGVVYKPMLSGQIVPLALLTCSPCGYSVSINLVSLGLWAKWQALSQIILPGTTNGKSVG